MRIPWEYEPAAKHYSQLPVYRQRLNDIQQRRLVVEHTFAETQRHQERIAYDPALKQQLQETFEDQQAKIIQSQQQLVDHQRTLGEIILNLQTAQADNRRAQHYRRLIQETADVAIREERLSGFLAAFLTAFFDQNTRDVGTRTAELLRYAITDQSILDIVITSDDLYYVDCSAIPRPVDRLSGVKNALLGSVCVLRLRNRRNVCERQGRFGFSFLMRFSLLLMRSDVPRSNIFLPMFSVVAFLSKLL